MRWKSTPEAYGRAAIAMHWVSAALILGLLAAGFIAANTADPAAKASILRLHAPLGITVLVLTLARLLWWALADRKPPQPKGLPAWQSMSARLVHIGLMVATLGLAGSGIALFAWSGAGAIVMAGAPQPLPDFWDYPPRYAHAALARLAVILVALHIAAALYHQFVRKDRIFSRMGVGQ